MSDLRPSDEILNAFVDGQFSPEDRLRGHMIEQLMCKFRIDAPDLCQRFDISPQQVHNILRTSAAQFGGLLHLDEQGLRIPHEARPLTRMIARSIDAYALSKAGHSSAI